MAISKTEIGQFAMEAMDSFFNEYSEEELANLHIEDLMLLASIRRTVIDPSTGREDGVSGTYLYSSNPRGYIQKGLLTDALDMSRGN